ncbi:NAD(P)H-hydrate dehydratase [Sphingobium boeckii]|uniref:Bifunctional NAD(P)H-hydrate repair enzyme n=1 Tax=Sphingobium boeckii TaxID=1082345 RepID=A0A7W9AKG7_9SPHN|nr:NAD(P)H-hydrate dehydratase [Sphingobium boeckii]MBB5687131.1 hydroxyethylthiazole kinase-like uncharacterized protein yjeF [Sphingobium boeckii]
MSRGRAILTAAAMRAAEDRAIARGASVESLMARAGKAVAEAAWRFGGGRPVLILCGPGNNGGDGYVAARVLKALGANVRVAAPCDPQSEAAIQARRGWDGPVEPLTDTTPAPMLVDALFGTGLSRPLQPDVADALMRLVSRAHLALAVDLPSGLATDTGALLAPVPHFSLTLALGALKPVHLLQPAAHLCGAVRVADIGIATESLITELARPHLAAPGPADHKYSRGFVAVVGGGMPGAARLSATAALRAGSGMVKLLGGQGGPDALVCRPIEELAATLADKRLNAVVIGPGLSPDAAGRSLLDQVMAGRAPAVMDAGALRLIGDMGAEALKGLPAMAILTPHDGEFESLFGKGQGSKIDRAGQAAAASGAVIVFKGADTVIASPDGQIAVAPDASAWLSTGGTGDVLAGIVAAMRARGLDAFDAACAGVWLHGDAARRAGPAFVADDLANHLPAAIAACL